MSLPEAVSALWPPGLLSRKAGATSGPQVPGPGSVLISSKLGHYPFLCSISLALFLCYGQAEFMNNFFFYRDKRDVDWMELALQEAARAAEKEEIPVGAVVVCDGKVIGQAHNRREELQNPIAHAEILALEDASLHLRSWRLPQCTLYVTLEPCIMCVGAILQARISRLVFGCLDPKGGAVKSLYRLCEDSRLNHRPAVARGVLEGECAGILGEFFARLREKERAAKRAERWPSPVEGA